MEVGSGRKRDAGEDVIPKVFAVAVEFVSNSIATGITLVLSGVTLVGCGCYFVGIVVGGVIVVEKSLEILENIPTKIIVPWFLTIGAFATAINLYCNNEDDIKTHGDTSDDTTWM